MFVVKPGAVILLFAVLFAGNVSADVFRPAYLELRELTDGHYAVLWKAPLTAADSRSSAHVRFPAGTEITSASGVIRAGGTWTERWQVWHPDGLEGKAVTIAGATAGLTDVIARLERLDDSSQIASLPLDKPVFVIAPPRGMIGVAGSYLVIGVEHILGGLDHLLFVLALLLIVKGTRRLIATITAFTLAHSLTLAAASLGWVQVPAAPVEAIIALSIVFVAAEFLHSQQGRIGITERAPWIVAFSFGLLHGFGFAGALSEVGLPDEALALALLTFNVGVELGQLLFIAAFLLLRDAAARLHLPRLTGLSTLTAYGVGSIATYWTIERIAQF